MKHLHALEQQLTLEAIYIRKQASIQAYFTVKLAAKDVKEVWCKRSCIAIFCSCDRNRLEKLYRTNEDLLYLLNLTIYY
jgi:hypothetical protein